MMNHALGMPRRQFLVTTGAMLGAPYFVPATALASRGRPGANDRLTVAHIGVGGMGGGHLQRMTEFRAEGRVNIAAVCDVDERQLANAVQTAGQGVTPYRDYRYICLRDDIDAVVIATPDHWHAVQTVHACETGKHVYVEKPSSVTVQEGRAMVTAARAPRTQGPGGCSRTDRLGRLLHVPRDPQWNRGQGGQGYLLALRQSGGRRPAGLCAAGGTRLGPVAGAHARSFATIRRTAPARSAGFWNPAEDRSAIAVRISSARFCGA